MNFFVTTSLPALAQTDILVEIHSRGMQTPQEVEQQIASLLKPSHHIQILKRVPRNLEEIRARHKLLWSAAELEEAADEHRGFDQQWLWAEAKKN